MSSTSETSLQDDIFKLTMKEILVRFKGVLKFSRDERTKKDLLVTRVLRDAAPTAVEFLHKLAQDKRTTRQSQQHSTKRTREEVEETS